MVGLRTITLDDGVILSMLRDTKFLQLLPCLSRPQEDLNSIQPGNTNCQACETAKAATLASAMNLAKDCIISAPADRLEKLRVYFNADVLRISKMLANGHFAQYTK